MTRVYIVRAILRASLVHSGRPIFVPETSLFHGGRGGAEVRCGNVWRSRVVFVRTFRAFLEYILPAGGSGAINITRGLKPFVRPVTKGVKTPAPGRESNSFPSQPFLTRQLPLPVQLSRVSISVYLGGVGPHISGRGGRERGGRAKRGTVKMSNSASG